MKKLVLRERLSVKAPRPPRPSSAAVSKAMKGNKASGTRPELALRRALRQAGFEGMRFSPQDLPGRPDVLFPGKRLAIFLNGCFWHRCPFCSNPIPKTHNSYWTKKFTANVLRDKKKRRRLWRADFRVLTIWECRFKKAELVQVARVKKALEK